AARLATGVGAVRVLDPFTPLPYRPAMPERRPNADPIPLTRLSELHGTWSLMVWCDLCGRRNLSRALNGLARRRNIVLWQGRWTGRGQSRKWMPTPLWRAPSRPRATSE